jgi:hypothetical protein
MLVLMPVRMMVLNMPRIHMYVHARSPSQLPVLMLMLEATMV